MKIQAAIAAVLALSACAAQVGPGAGMPHDVARADQQPAILAPAAPTEPEIATDRMADGRCKAREITPAVYEHVMGEVQVLQAEIAEDGTVIRPPVYRRAPVPRVVRPRAELSFDAPCPENLTPDFIASVQRALAARGYFAGNVTGALDAPTAAAIRRYQSERGLQSSQISLETARALGLVIVASQNG